MDESPRMHPFGPSDSAVLLTWERPDGRSQTYPISYTGGYRDLEARLRRDGAAVWLVSRDWNSVIATLDLGTGRFTDDGGAVYNAQACQSMVEAGKPAWATRTGGLVLAHKLFR